LANCDNEIKTDIMKILLSNIIKVTLAIILVAGCSKDTLTENPPNILAGQTIFKDLAGFNAGINGLYNISRHGRWQSEKIENAVNGVDNTCSNYRRSDIFWNWGASNSPADADLLQTYQWLYEIVNSANTIIYYADGKDVNWTGGSDTPENNRLKVIAEARAIRAWAYRRLAYSWGDVPLTLTLESKVKTDWERTPVAEVRKQAIKDYAFAQQYIPTEGTLSGRITKGAVQTLLAEMYLTLNKPDSALYWCNQVIGNTAYQLVTARYGVKKTDPTGSPFGDMFKEGNQNRETGNTEALWVFQFTINSAIDAQGTEMPRAEVGNYNLITISGKRPLQYTFERGGRGKAYFGPTKWWIDSYEKQDDRAQNYIMRKYYILSDATTNAPYPADVLPSAAYKYGDTIKLAWATPLSATFNSKPDWPHSRKADGADPNNMQSDFAPTDQIYIRLADTYLLKAEAQFKLSDATGAAATINTIRARSKATPITPAQVTLDYILDERSRELFIEEERRGTLLRTRKWYDRTKLYNTYGGEKIALRDTLFPIPQDVIDANLTKPFPQNPGW
jgi:starch-binding outer membrane protein, SusD/RagB family